MDFSLNEEQKMYVREAKEFTEREIVPRIPEMEETARLPDDLLRKMGEVGYFGMTVPPEYGGSGAGSFAHLLVVEQMAYAGAPAWWAVAFNNSLPETIYRFGSETVKKKYLKESAFDGSQMFSIQFTEADTGSDPAALITTSKVNDSMVTINGMKRFSTFGARPGIATCYTKDEDGNCTCYITEKHKTGYTAPKIWQLMGGGGIEPADVYYEDYQIPVENQLGTRGKGLDCLLWWISDEKTEGCIVATALGQAALDEAVTYAKSRTVRGRPMSALQGIRWELADMYAQIEACRWLTYRAAMLGEEDDPNFMTEAAACKIFVQPVMNEVVALGLRLHGGYGYTKDFKVERLYRAQPGNVVISVSLEINKSIVGGNLVRD